MRRSIQSIRERASELAERDNLGVGEFIDWAAAAEDITIGTFTLGRVVYRVV